MFPQILEVLLSELGPKFAHASVPRLHRAHVELTIAHLRAYDRMMIVLMALR